MEKKLYAAWIFADSFVVVDFIFPRCCMMCCAWYGCIFFPYSAHCTLSGRWNSFSTIQFVGMDFKCKRQLHNLPNIIRVCAVRKGAKKVCVCVCEEFEDCISVFLSKNRFIFFFYKRDKQIHMENHIQKKSQSPDILYATWILIVLLGNIYFSHYSTEIRNDILYEFSNAWNQNHLPEYWATLWKVNAPVLEPSDISVYCFRIWSKKKLFGIEKFWNFVRMCPGQVAQNRRKFYVLCECCIQKQKWYRRKLNRKMNAKRDPTKYQKALPPLFTHLWWMRVVCLPKKKNSRTVPRSSVFH